jgi:hypothetical protein
LRTVEIDEKNVNVDICVVQIKKKT